MQYVITFASDIDSNDAFDGLVSEQGFEHISDDGWFEDETGMSIKNIGGKLYVKGDDPVTVKTLVKFITDAYKDYAPSAHVVKCESLKPHKNFAKAYRAMTEGNLKKHLVSEATKFLKDEGAIVTSRRDA